MINQKPKGELEKDDVHTGCTVIKSSFFNYKLATSQKYLHILILAIGIFNLMLLVPDVMLVDSTIKKVSIIILRAIFSLTLLGLFLKLKNIKTFNKFSKIITSCELFSLIIFLFVLSQYTNPDFLIQTLGMITIIIIIFFVPNRWTYMLMTSVLGAIGFFVCASVFIKSVYKNEIVAAVIYFSITILLCSIFAWNTEKHQLKEFVAKDKLEQNGSIDYLTNTANRFKMKEEADRWIDICHKQGLPLSLVFIDVDDLKVINDRYGHLVGDTVLVNIAKLICSQMRESDVLARFGGDEFVLLLPDISLKNAVALSESIKNIIGSYSFIKGKNVTCSLGVVESKEDSSFEGLLHEADILMYSGKKLGKNNVQWSKSI